MPVNMLFCSIRVIVDLSAFLFAISGERFICNEYEVLVTHKPVITTLLINNVC